MAFNTNGAVSGAATGATTGAMFGPWGAAIGGVVGLVAGGFGGGGSSSGGGGGGDMLSGLSPSASIADSIFGKKGSLATSSSGGNFTNASDIYGHIYFSQKTDTSAIIKSSVITAAVILGLMALFKYAKKRGK